jgi:5-formyltetrahydrofolate cyclo-ligase
MKRDAAALHQSNRTRQALRRQFRRQRKSLGERTQKLHAAAVARHFLVDGPALSAHTVGLYVAADGEVDLSPLLARLLRMRKRIALPVVRSHAMMTFHRYRAQTHLTPNRFGILEPSGEPLLSLLAIDLLLVPLVAFDEHGTRLGMGAGYYDRCLGRLPSRLRPRLIGVAHETQRSREPLPRAPWDVPLHGVLTEDGWQRFDNNSLAVGQSKDVLHGD